MRIAAYLFSLLALAGLSFGAESPKRLAIPADAQKIALLDAKGIDDARYIRWVYVSDGQLDSARRVNLTLGYISLSSTPFRSPFVAGNRLVRVDLTKYAENEADLQTLLRIWEDFRFDPSFATLITRDSIASAKRIGGVFPGVIEVGDRKLLVRAGAEDGDYKWVDTIAVPGRHLDRAVDAELRRLTHSNAPVVEDRYFTFRALSTIRDKGVYDDVFGGRYYDFKRLRRAKGSKGTDLAALFERVGIGDVEKNLDAEAVFKRAKSEQRVAMFRSRVTGKPRRIVFFPTLATRFGDGQGFIAITFDIGRADIDVGSHAMMTLKKGRFKALEVIWRDPNGLHGFALFNANGELQDEAPPDVVSDHRIPEPNTKELSGAISCIRCHGYDGHDGMKPAPNDVQAFRKLYQENGPDIFGDVSDHRKTLEETLDELGKLYAGDHNPGLMTARRDYIRAILASTDQTFGDGAKDANLNIGKLTAVSYKTLWEDYWYGSVTPVVALRELGYDVPEKDALRVLRTLLPKPKKEQLPHNVFVIEDARIAGVLLNIDGGITRADWALAYSFAAARVRATEERLLKQQQEKK